MHLEADLRRDMPHPEAEAVAIHGLTFAWTRGAAVLDLPRLLIGAREHVFLKGPSGSGKSTLLGLIAGVLLPRQGMVRVLGEDIVAMRPADRDAHRAAHVGVIFQMFNLLPYLTVLDNVTLPCRFSAERAARAADPDTQARRLLDALGMGDPRLLSAKAGELSAGQQQRVAAARALIGRPGLILADEPTSALDADARDAFIRLLLSECERSGAALLFVSHDARLAGHFHRAVELPALNRAGLPRRLAS
jgi:putative ABC transport system ATP-binding protein